MCRRQLKKTKPVGKGIFTKKGEEIVQRKVYLGAGCKIVTIIVVIITGRVGIVRNH